MDRSVARNAAGTVRNLALQVPFNFGPFNSLSIPGKSLEAIVYLAVGLHGWWKSPETTNSLLSVIKMHHADNEILCAQNFELAIFEAVENDHPFHGAVISDEENGLRALRGIKLDGSIIRGRDEPKAIMCMRALTSGLLCLFRRSDVFDILFNIMQKCLIHFHQADVQFDRYGPFSRALNDWIEAESTRENFRQKAPTLMRQLDTAALEFAGVGVKDLQVTQFFETDLVIAFLHWLFAEEYKHDPAIRRDYPTRSFHVWSLAFILNKLGFLVEASAVPIQSRETWEGQVFESSDTNHLWRVHLVTSSFFIADPSYNHRPSRRIDFRERRIIPLGSIPTIAFDFFRYYDKPDLNFNFLNEVFNTVFSDVTKKLPRYTYLQALADLRGETSSKELPEESPAVHSQMTNYQQHKLEDWVENPRISQLLQKSIQTYIPKDCPDSCGKARCHWPTVPFEDSDSRGDEEAGRWRAEVRKDHSLMSPWIIMHIIMLAFAYAVACQFVIADDGKRADLDTEICWTPIRFFENSDDWEKVRLIIPDGDLKTWVRTMSDMLNAHLEPIDRIPTEKWPQHRRLKKTLFHMICGHRSEGLSSKTRDVIHDFILGCSANGLSLVSKILVNPSANASDLHLYYVRFGRILELPVNSDKVIEGCNPAKRPKHFSKFDPATQPRVWDADLRKENTLSKDVRWDTEPDWSADYTKVGLCCRLNGLSCGIFNPWWLARRSCVSEEDPERCPCRCSSNQNSQTITFPSREHWIEYHLRDFYRGGLVFNLNYSQEDHMNAGETRNIFIRAGEQAHNQLAALDMIVARASNKPGNDLVVRKILSPCLLCAAESARIRPSHWTGLFRGQMNSKKFVNFVILAS